MAKNLKTYEYQTEVKKLLDIVIHSLYTNKDIFVRELISNASDALEKFRYLKLTNGTGDDLDLPMEIKIELNDKGNTFIISDTGVGMTEEELIENLGTIAHSGSGEFLKKMAENKGSEAQLIGQFGVGFYSAFMVAKRVRVITRNWQKDAPGLLWESDGISNYTISREEGIKRGTRIMLDLEDDYKDYTDADKIKQIIKEYSNFVSFPILVGDEKVNTIQSIWTRSSSEVTEEEYKEFYKFQENAYSDPFFWLHTSSDAPLQLNALLYFPQDNIEEFGFSRLEPGVSLYCNKILIMNKVKDLLPEYMRFVKGVVDSEDLPLNISRETLQDNRIIGKLGKFLTKRVITFLQDKAKNDPEKYNEFWQKFHLFIKEGANADWENKEELAKLLRFESSATETGKWTSLEEYKSRMKDDQKEIYYLSGTSRSAVENSPYMEAFKANEYEVLFLYEPIDDFVMTSMREFDGKKLVSADQATLDVKSKKSDKDDDKDDKASEKEVKELAKYIKELSGEKLEDVKLSQRLVSSPALLVNPDDMMTTQMQKILQATKNDMYSVGKKVLEINPKHELIQSLARMLADKTSEDLLKEISLQIIDNAFITAGLSVDNNQLVSRMYHILSETLK